VALLLFLSPAPVWLGAAILLHGRAWAVLGANILLKPVQAHINRGVRSNRQALRLAELKPLIIGVAGSNGKDVDEVLH
jgi:hypothetical protein